MFLKKIAISGFKSFADKITLTFDKGITGVVGPNGSGKSNIIDSVRWVMGEQNAKNLRGEKATDIIFAGSERRKPLGMAEVSLIFDNSEDDPACPPEYRHDPEISLTRRLYADGQREYLINKKPCRLKDIVGFFAATGLGGRSYSMIQQGQVDRILNAKPEDVREILEEAAGTTVYKKRKQEAEKKLEQTQLNLSRIEDILIEVDRQLGTLQTQVEKAREWQDLTNSLRQQEMLLFGHNYHHFNEQKSKLAAKLDECHLKEAEVLSSVSGLEARQQDLQGQLDEADPDMQGLQEAIAVIREKIARSESLLKSSADRIASGRKRLEDIAGELEEDDANLKVLESQVDAAERELSSAESVAANLAEAIETFQYEVESAEEAAQVYQGRMDEFEDEIRNLERLIENNRYRSETTEDQLKKCARSRAEHEQRMSTLERELDDVDRDVQEAERQAAGRKEGLDQDIREKHDREAAVAARYAEMKEAHAQRDELREKYHEVRGRYTSLQDLAEGATDVAGSVAKLKEEDERAAELIQGLLTDYISFGDSIAELPQRTVSTFERWAERVVVEQLDDFNDLVRLSHACGTSSIPVSLLTRCEAIDRDAAARWANANGAEPLRQYLKIERPSGAIELLVDRLYLLPALQLSDDVFENLPRGLVVFTSQGVCFTAQDELMIGGKSGAGLLSRKTELEHLAAEMKVIEGDLARAQSRIDDLEFKINEDRQIIADIDAKLQQQNQDVLEVMSALQSVQQLADRKRELIEIERGALERCRIDQERLEGELETLRQNRSSLEKELDSNRSELQGLEEESASLIDRKEEVRRQHEAKNLELAKSESRAQALKDSYLTTKAQLELLQNKLSRRYEERVRIEQDIEKAEREQDDSKNDIESFLRERETLQANFAAKREENAGLLEELRVIENRLRDHRNEQNQLQKATNECQMQVERLQMAISGVKAQAIEKYKLDIESYEFDYDENFKPDSAAKAVQKLRDKLESMGAINMMALKEYEEKNERREFIVRQRDEVISSIELLIVAISEIEETSLRKFLEIYETVNTEFGRLFPILFPTGEGKLVLTNEENPLEAGIEILCRLPGKSQKSMSLFSGGEKALTAMALIFALLRTKPTPYCFLDEVDAPLDEANVGRYNRVLEALSSQFQFIVITHNRRTMEVLDTLYGITMQEPGVSKVVGVDMQKDLPSHLRKAFKDDKIPPAQRSERALEGASAR